MKKFTCETPFNSEPSKEVGRLTLIISANKKGDGMDLFIKKKGDVSGIARLLVYYPTPGYQGPDGPVPASDSLWTVWSQKTLNELKEKLQQTLNELNKKIQRKLTSGD